MRTLATDKQTNKQMPGSENGIFLRSIFSKLIAQKLPKSPISHI